MGSGINHAREVSGRHIRSANLITTISTGSRSQGYGTKTTLGAKVDGQFSQPLWPTVYFFPFLSFSPLCYIGIDFIRVANPVLAEGSAVSLYSLEELWWCLGGNKNKTKRTNKHKQTKKSKTLLLSQVTVSSNIHYSLTFKNCWGSWSQATLWKLKWENVTSAVDVWEVTDLWKDKAGMYCMKSTIQTTQLSVASPVCWLMSE